MMFLIIGSVSLLLSLVIAILYSSAAPQEDVLFDLSILAGSVPILTLCLPGLIDRIETQCFACWSDHRIVTNDVIVVVDVLLDVYLLRIMIPVILRKQRKT